MNIQSETIKSRHGYSLFKANWEPNTPVKATVVMIHGFGEHILRYTPYFELFENEGIRFTGFDLHGHGQSAGKRGTILSYHSLINDIAYFVDQAKEQYPNVPVFIYGHSMGGNLAMNFLIENITKVDGAIVSSPWLKLHHNPNKAAQKVAEWASNIFPNTTMPSDLSATYLSRITVEVEKYKTDPLNHGRISFRLLHKIMERGRYAIENAGRIAVPVLLLHGSADQITSCSASEKAAFNNPEFILFKRWPDGYHELQNDLCRNDLANTVKGWVSERITNKKTQ